MNAVDKYLSAVSTSWKEDATAVDGVFYYLVVSLMVHSPEKWMENRVTWLKRMLAVCGNNSKQLGNAKFTHYRSGMIFLGIIHGLYTIVFKVHI
jgi:hypothetical protein